MFKGSLPALVTPFAEDGSLDEATFAAFVEWQIGEGSHGLVPVGTTGESPTLTHGEHKRIVEICIETTRGRVPVVAGAGSNNTVEAIELAQFAEKAGADGL
ncbi:dihydrodipicolinate synthase family protein, partial [Aurantimonas coralicida]